MQAQALPLAPAFRGPDAVRPQGQSANAPVAYAQRPPSKHKLQRKLPPMASPSSTPLQQVDAGGLSGTCSVSASSRGSQPGGALLMPIDRSASIGAIALAPQSFDVAAERPGLEPGKPQSARSATGFGTSEWSWCMRSDARPRRIGGTLEEVPSFMRKTYSVAESTFGPSYIPGKKANEPFYGTARSFGAKTWDGKMLGGEKAREGYAGTQKIFGRGWRHEVQFSRP